VTSNAVVVDGVWKTFRLYRERNQYIKAAILRGRRARYEEFMALKDVSFEVPHGSTFGIIGSNGSGKSTMLKCLARILVPDRGSVSINGRVAPLLELGAGFHPELSGRENVFLNGAILGLTKKEIQKRYDDIVGFSGLEKFIDTPLKNYSSGMTVRLGFAIAVNVDPEILIIDEVLSVGDAAFQLKCMEKIEDFRKSGKTIIFVSHGLSQVEQLCEQALWLEKGVARQLGPSAEVVAAYSAESHGARPQGKKQLNRWGSGEIQISSVKLLDEHGREIDTVYHGKPATVEINGKSLSTIQDFGVRIRMTHLHGQVVSLASTRRSHVAFEREQGSKEFRVAALIPRVDLLAGTYDLSITLTDSAELHEYDHLEKVLRFDVDQSSSLEEGLVSLGLEWSIAQ
jgi:ABC-type polysaccharide/polyol phosphate transport system ATPase subunit